MPIEPWWETNPATTPRQELGMVSPELSPEWKSSMKTDEPRRVYLPASLCRSLRRRSSGSTDRSGHVFTTAARNRMVGHQSEHGDDAIEASWDQAGLAVQG